MNKFVSSPQATHMVATKKNSNILEEPQIMEYFSCEMEKMLLFFMLYKLGKRPWQMKIHNWSTHCPILWSNHFQSTMALSKIKVEYCLLSKVARQVTWL
jgi:hypothetical protein